MSEFDDVYNDSEVECPYCGNKYQPECETYDEREREEECEECGKKYRFYQSFDVTHITEPDCELNGDAHKYEMHNLTGGRQYPFCAVCNKCQPYSDLES